MTKDKRQMTKEKGKRKKEKRRGVIMSGAKNLLKSSNGLSNWEFGTGN